MRSPYLATATQLADTQGAGGACGAARPIVRQAEVRDARAREPLGQQARLVVLQQVAAQVQPRQARRSCQRLRCTPL